MSGLNTSEYYRRRADQAERLAAAANLPEVRAIHTNMAARYADLAELVERGHARPVLKLAL